MKINLSDRVKREIKEWVESIVIAVVLALLIRCFVVQAFKIPSGSMRPTLVQGDRLLVNKFLYGARIPFTGIRLPKVREPKIGDIIVFKYPEDPKKDFIKRLIATGGDTVEITDGDIMVNGKLVDDPLAIKEIYYYNRGEFGVEDEAVTVPEGHFYVLGDNSGASRDSRYWGFVPKENMIGKAIFLFWPPRRIGTLR